MKTITLLFFSISSITTSIAFGAPPLISSQCEVAKDIRINESNQGFFMSADCKTVYVLPPTYGFQSISGRTVGNLDRCQDVKALNKSLAEINTQITSAIKSKIDDELINSLFLKRKKILNEYSDLSNTLGASIEFNFNMAIDKNLQRFRDNNSGLGVNIVPVNLRETQLKWDQKQDQDPDMRIAFNQTLSIDKEKDIGSGSFSARLDLSLFGACPLRDPFTRELPDRIRVQDLAGLITPNVIYKYEVGAKYTYVARYNRGALAKKIRDSASNGGFFKTSTTSTIIDSAETSGWFSLDIQCDDLRVCELAKTETASQIKQRLIQEVLDGISLARIGYPMQPIDSKNPGRNGSSVTADHLRKCPHPYCQAGAIVLDIASATFGGESKTDSYISINNHISEEKVEMTTPVQFTGVMGFKH